MKKLTVVALALPDISHMTCSRDPRGMLNFIECHFITADGVCKLNSAMPRPDF